MDVELISSIRNLKKSRIGTIVRKKMAELRERGKDRREVFSELCFCILTANASARMGIKIQKIIGDGFERLSLHELRRFLQKEGYRFYNKRAEYIVEARRWMNIQKILKKFRHDKEAREWLVKHVKGFGYKEASHFLRNIGRNNVAILDRHILRIMAENKLIEKVPRSLTRNRYLEYEKKLEKIAKKLEMSQGELDFYLWYLKRGEVLK